MGARSIEWPRSHVTLGASCDSLVTRVMSDHPNSGADPHRAVVLLAPELTAERRVRAQAIFAEVRRELGTHGHGSGFVDLGQAAPRALDPLTRTREIPTVVHLGGSLALGDEAALSVLLARFDALRCVILDGQFDPSQATRIGRIAEWIVRIPVTLDLRLVRIFATCFHLALAEGEAVNLAFYAALDRARLEPTDRAHAPQLIHRGRPHLAPAPNHDPDSGELIIAMSDDERARLLALIERSCGIASSVAVDLRLERRLSPRLEALDLPSYAAYLDHIEFDADGETELQSVIARITTHETYFFREQYQLDAMVESVLPELARRHASDRALRLWSAGCSTGEEAYTLAILALDSGLFAGWDLRVTGLDISERVLDVARAGVYGPNSFRTTSAKLRDKYFVADGRRWTVRDEVKAMCGFEQHNLLDTVDEVPVDEQPELISCRNVLIYLSERARKQVIAGFHAQLRPRGYLLLGHSETKIDTRGRFELLPALRRELIYQRVGV